MKKPSFNTKIFLIFSGVFFFFATLLLLFSGNSLKYIMQSTVFEELEKESLVIQHFENIEEVKKHLETEAYSFFFWISLWDKDLNIVYSLYSQRFQELGIPTGASEVANDLVQAQLHGVGSFEQPIKNEDDELWHFSKQFEFQGEHYYLRGTVPRVRKIYLKKEFLNGLIIFCGALLLALSIITLILVRWIVQPIQQIISQVRPFQQGTVDELPKIAIHPIHDEFASLASIFNQLVDRVRSQINAIRQTQKEHETILESLTEGVVAINSKHQITFINPIACEILKLKKRETLTKSINILPYPLLAELLFTCAKTQQIQIRDLIIKKQEILVLHAIAVPVESGDTTILVIQDQTAEYEMLELRKEFIANASHELKTPITIIRGFAELLNENPDMDPAIVKKSMETIFRNCQRMERLVVNLLALSRVENLSHLHAENCNIEELATKIIKTVQERYPQAVITHEVHSDQRPLKIEANVELLELALMNLLTNAAKYSTEQPEVTFKISQLSNAKISFEITDKGIGIPQQEQKKIFQRFYRIESGGFAEKKVEGSGLGLAIVKNVAQRHSGELTLKSEEGKGSTFTITLPQKQNP